MVYRGRGVPWRSAVVALVVGALTAGSLTTGASMAVAVDETLPPQSVAQSEESEIGRASCRERG